MKKNLLCRTFRLVIIFTVASCLNLQAQQIETGENLTDTTRSASSRYDDISLPPVEVLPRSPKAASIIRFGEYPVSLYTGLVDITIPIYTIERSGVKVPVEFKYHASGIKYDDVSLEVGLGWSLVAEGRYDSF